jgi:hypothetical protein
MITLPLRQRRVGAERRHGWHSALGVLAFAAGCGGAGATTPDDHPDARPAPPLTPAEPAPEPVPIRRLTTAEYTASTSDLFPGMALPEVSLLPDTRVLGFLNVSSAQTGNLVWAEQYEAAAQKIAETVTADPIALVGCDATSVGEVACAQPYVFGLAKRAYRRPLDEAEKDRLWSLFLDPENGDYPSRLALTVAAVLVSPKFLFRPEVGRPTQGTPDKSPALTPWEVATRLSYLINGSIPDTALAAAADQDQLSTPSQIGDQARRLLALPRSQDNLVKMHEMWLRIDSVGSLARDAAKYPGFTSGLALAMAQESRLFLHEVMFRQEGTFADLLQAPYTFANAELAALYGVPAPATDWDRIELDPEQRSGLLTEPALLATLAKDVSDEGGTPIGTSIYRGKFVLEQLLCRTVVAPTPDIVAQFPPQDWTKTTREASEAHRVSPVCAGCHASLDPLGLPFEHYDALGQWRDTDRGMPIDASGSVVVTDTNQNTTQIAFDGVPALSRIVATLPETRACYVSQWYRFATGKLNADEDQVYIGWLANRFTGDKKLVDLLIDLVTSDGFRHLSMRSAP